MKKSWFHAIGVCGKTTANVAKMFKEMGWFVTGSDAQFLPPASDIITENEIHHVEGYSFKHLTKEFWEEKLGKKLNISNHPDLGLIMSFLSPSNKEYRYAKLHNIDIRPYAQVLRDYLIKENSVVVAGTAGKTTTTTFITKLLQSMDFDPSYMIGADVVDLDESLKNTESEWSVVEGDEYHSPEIEGQAKFMEYKPTFLVLTNIGWEHQDIFETQKRYNEEFEKLVKIVPEDGLVVAHYPDKSIDKVVEASSAKVIRYASSELVKSQKLSPEKIKEMDLWQVQKQGETNIVLDPKQNEVMRFKTRLLGDYNLENILAGLVLVLSLPTRLIPADILLKGTGSLKHFENVVAQFQGVKKRLEVIYSSENLTVIDDFGVAPSRAINSLNTITSEFDDHKIIAVFEPNGASRPRQKKVLEKMYEGVFDNTDEVIIPDLSEFDDKFLPTNEMVEHLNSLKVNAQHIGNDNLVSELKKKVKSEKGKVVVVFFSSYRLTDPMLKFVKEVKK